ncbi:TRAP transporter small permease subunit [Variovorax sp. V59]|jgi:TRAP-type C4-dicarboxylate transport system, small permease component|uniref:TRAP transporter small permease protein n=2 Tax=Variovorax TaxID=34072 RepID=A0AAE3XZ53_VARPD|nr:MULTISPECIES: TRAP transporter small permease [Variovorax]MBD9662955.1 TRAP transporter small permease [Variovorax sp. VRV01]MDP9963366.1 TRAP-type C4-dicarboxylate transport system permease small subunit [Variovorax paradoxus]MDR6426383.1 TRAP-type C4-dicarboxylate transport system permease small subunit [Variovorax paradoxus]MDR6451364.1 TRAP-type C4-dicarboxylate transport system permease small subunit [Variovorax paradoxus]TWD78568.1 TRAP-type C4-dicarboxylate transport system permease 
MAEHALERGSFSRRVLDASDFVLRCERHLLSALMGLLIALVLLNVATRYAGVPIYWVDEASVYCVVWLTFIGASAMTRLRLDFAVTLLTDKLGEKAVRIAKATASGGVLLLGFALLAMCWLYMDPLGIARYGFDAKEYAAESFNFLYTERTQTLNWPTWAIQLILPVFSLTLSLHALSNLIEDLGLQPRRTHTEFHVTNADAVN